MSIVSESGKKVVLSSKGKRVSTGESGSIVHKRTVHLIPSERIKGVRMLRWDMRHPGFLSLSLSLFSFLFLSYFTSRSWIVCGHRVHRAEDPLRDGTREWSKGAGKWNGLLCRRYVPYPRYSPQSVEPTPVPIPLFLPRFYFKRLKGSRRPGVAAIAGRSIAGELTLVYTRDVLGR